MSTPLTMTRLVRWRVRDWASCFLACRFSLDDEQETFPNSSSKLPIRNMVFGVKKDSTRGGNKINKKLSKKNKKFRQVNPGSTQATVDSSVSVQNCNSRDSCRPHLQDEEYIVFCFGEDGGFDVVKECKSPETFLHFTANNTSPRSVNRKEEEAVDSHSGLDPPCNARTTWCHIGENDNCGTVSAKSSDSNQSDGSSTGSFSFPVMHWELIGSPVQMPKSESLHARKHKAPCARFQCCRF
ncbi:hypothetical protein Peur_069395 [Populus x canadensis]|uniref:Uncharacterized protein n=1 Tax=Populus deltoides TaxID=3696 RepID=A0A8T2X3H4_POPDE|nr:hypothetical protein H0E87_026017 [Populus deltoides]